MSGGLRRLPSTVNPTCARVSLDKRDVGFSLFHSPSIMPIRMDVVPLWDCSGRA
jgi:hypothetical protein